MSYSQMDHAAWVEANNIAGRQMYKKASRDSYGTAIGYHGAPEKLTAFHARVMDILGMVGGGIYNAPICWNSVDWDYGRGVSVLWKDWQSLATFDAGRLTMLVFLCHEARIRVQVEPAMKHLRLSFWQREATGCSATRHPNLDEAVAAFRKYLPEGHRIIYRAPDAEAAA